jgi:formylglycine-generating enzyme required for sulfatase activity
MREVAVRTFARRGLAWGPALIVAAACHSAPSKGGLVIVLSLDATLKVSDLSKLTVEVDPDGDGGVASWTLADEIPSQLSSFPATVAIQSNGQATASVVLHLRLWSRTSPATLVDARDYQVANIPVDTVSQLDVVFSRQCTPGQARCGSGTTCCPRPAGAGGCSSQVVNAATPTVVCESVEDSGAPEASVAPEAGPDDGPADDGSAGEASLADAAAADATLADATLDAPADGSVGHDGPLEEADAPPPLPVGSDGGPRCATACVEGKTHCVDGACVPVPPSCQGGGLGAGFNCGANGFGTEDCCGTLDTPLGARDWFYLDDSASMPSTSYPATVSRFRLDALEVTVGRFRKFIAAASGEDGGVPWVPPPGSGKHVHLPAGGLNAGGNTPGIVETGWDSAWNSNLPITKAAWDARLFYCQTPSQFYSSTWTPDVDPNHDKLPITCLDWYTAYAFCIWDGGFLPSTTEWEFAAVGGRTQRTFAWGEQVPGSNTNLAIWGCYYGTSPLGGTGNPCTGEGLGNVAPVGSAPGGKGLWGQFDLTGSVYEWTLDYYSGAYANPCDDCADIRTGGERILRGGGFASSLDEIYNAFQTHSQPFYPHGDTGVRCARPPY